MENSEFIPLPKEKIDEIFEAAEDQRVYTINLYKVALPNWDEISQVNGFPKVNSKTNEYIFQKAGKFDLEKHPGVMNGGLWLNNGFSSLDAEDIPEWNISLRDVLLVMKKEV
jgi:hypothetical protein